MKNISMVVVMVGTLFFSSCNQNVNAQNNAPITISAKDFAKETKKQKGIQLLDVRTPEEYASGHIENADNIDFTNPMFEKNLQILDKNQPVYVYCLSGGRSAKAADRLSGLGFKKVYDIDGGMMKWRAANLPETKDNAGAANEMSIAQYESMIGENPVLLIDFYANWCEPCKRMKPYLDEIDRTMKDKVKVLRINVDKNKKLVKDLGVDALPVLMLYKDRSMVWKEQGFVPKEVVLEKLNN
ncbi:MAG: redoxin domain-containing protein [Bacteroidetes bacterium]|nr:redoxin domain-containing protein [Bacteroidota bacterium]